MSSSFDQPDDSAAWRWDDGDDRSRVRNVHDMLADLDAALGLLSDFVSSCDSNLAGQQGGNLSSSGHEVCVAAPNVDLSELGEPFLVAPAGHLLWQVDLLQAAVSVSIVIGQSKQWLDETHISSNKPVAPNRFDRPLKLAAQDSPIHSLRCDSEDVPGCRCGHCHPSEQQHGLWLKVANAAARLSTPDLADRRSELDPVCDQDVLFPVSLGIETSTLYVAFDGKQFVKVDQPGTESGTAKKASTSAAADVSESHPSTGQSSNTGASRSQVMRGRNGMMWGPHWTQDTRANDEASLMSDPMSTGFIREDCVDNAGFLQGADQHRVLPETDAARSHQRKSATKSHCLRYNATQETCRAVQPSSRSSEGCRDRRSCTDRDQKDDQ
jgi:hypothetical protein